MLRIKLNPYLKKDERAAISHYLIQHGQLQAAEWLTALRAFDLMGSSTVTHKQTETFSTIYSRLVEKQHADKFIKQLLTLETEIQREGERLKAAVARTIAQELYNAGLYRHDVPETRYLLAYCYYWWDSFARGYIFETQIYRDLTQSGIEFLAHNIRDPVERCSRSDLIILGREGDIKTSTYFLNTTRTEDLRHDFYIARLYDVGQHRYRIAVLMTEETWQDIDGDTIPATLDEVTNFFPQPVRAKYASSPLIISDYNLWKTKVQRRQQKEKNNEQDTS
jgi:hypothetical protein